MLKFSLTAMANSQAHYSIALLLIFSLGIFTSSVQASEDTDYQLLLRQFQEPLRSELLQVAQFVSRQHPGKIINIQSYSRNPDKYYRVKLINNAGYLKTYYVDQTINKVNP